MTSHSFLAHNPATVWPVPEQFRSIYSTAAELRSAGRVLFISGQFGVRPDGSLAEGFETQCEQAMNNVEALLAAAEMNCGNTVKLTYCVTRPADFPSLGRIRRERWPSEAAPSVTALAVAGLARPEYLIEIEAVAAAQS
ncbi:MAG: RidA family protein [Alphaproteobacteria bacterium]|nr:RidA family protein [Alphaproteobacteria bacterium]MBV9152735.1 RidA family protein [Alphaproteobacteria bacterium]MBV9967659.1 RidA family protein [Alphaproteobacteria bacterium]